ncbi:FXYD domain-containing ion transport regulator 6 [Etheostoma spectabile]|uniref:FXYD domain-containing ion transport regulator 6 n=1 Tax=Etheostoma spectabile TaxID=54343 RepID=UPI0013AF5A02|nr:FXYD domain-containing ion transport regulator 6-like [Etheostoma spectabile]
MATTETMFTDRSDFDYDYETLRTTGVVLAVVMFFSGILIALIPAHLEAKFHQRQRCLLKLYRKHFIHSKGRKAIQEPRQQIHTQTHQLYSNPCYG